MEGEGEVEDEVEDEGAGEENGSERRDAVMAVDVVANTNTS